LWCRYDNGPVHRGDIAAIRRAILRSSTILLERYDLSIAIQAIREYGAVVKMSVDDLFSAIEEHARDGVDFITVHCGVTRSAIARLKNRESDRCRFTRRGFYDRLDYPQR